MEDWIAKDENDYVQIGSDIAQVASIENNTSAKLHFEIWGKQEKQNPEHWLVKK